MTGSWLITVGIVGSDPYLAPEVYHAQKYDPVAVDVWSIAIIYCCMSLRRFPWKLPRTSDVSFKYFVADPTPGTPTVDSLRRGSSAPASGHGSGSRDGQHEGAHGHHGVASVDGTTDGSHGDGSTATKEQQTQPSIRGPWRLLRLLPRESRYIIGRMLDTEPSCRATLDEVMDDDWVSTRPYCRQEEGGRVIHAEGHTHILEPGSGDK